MKTRLLLVLGLVVGCGGPDAGAAGAGDAGSDVMGVDLSYGDVGVVIEGSAQTCRALGGTQFASGIQVGSDDPRELTMQFMSVAEGLDFSPLSRQGNMTGVPLQPGGGFDLVDLEDGVRQVIVSESVCEFDMTFVANDELAPGMSFDRYRLTFTCPALPFAMISTETSEGLGQSTVNLSGSYDCHMRAQ